MKQYYKSGSWNAVCDVCGLRFKSSSLKKRWDGLYTCNKDWEPKHPQLMIKSIKEDINVDFARPENDTFINVPYSTYVNDGYVDPGYVYEFPGIP